MHVNNKRIEQIINQFKVKILTNEKLNKKDISEIKRYILLSDKLFYFLVDNMESLNIVQLMKETIMSENFKTFVCYLIDYRRVVKKIQKYNIFIDTGLISVNSLLQYLKESYKSIDDRIDYFVKYFISNNKREILFNEKIIIYYLLFNKIVINKNNIYCILKNIQKILDTSFISLSDLISFFNSYLLNDKQNSECYYNFIIQIIKDKEYRENKNFCDLYYFILKKLKEEIKYSLEPKKELSEICKLLELENLLTN